MREGVDIHMISHVVPINSSEFSPKVFGDSKFAPCFLFFQGAKALSEAFPSTPLASESVPSSLHRIEPHRFDTSPSDDRSTCGDTFLKGRVTYDLS